MRRLGDSGRGDEMAQVTVFGRRDVHAGQRMAISEAIHMAAREALQLPAGKRFHRFCWLDADDFLYPDDRSARYLIVEVSMFAGRSVEAKKAFLRGIVANLGDACGIAPQDIEITITETPRENWMIRGVPGDELPLPYTVEV
jgi:phenylpyruvate tautomerase PptA (4-oxalocrotonate tautomerase family)